MKKLLLLLFLSLSISSLAQEKNKHERIKALKIAFITEELQLTENEAQKFWPIYNDHEAKYHKTRKEAKGKFRNVDFESISDQDAKSHIEEWMTLEEKRHDLKLQFVKDLLKVLPAKKIIKLKATEDAFNRRMMEQFKKRREGFRTKNNP